MRRPLRFSAQRGDVSSGAFSMKSLLFIEKQYQVKTAQNLILQEETDMLNIKKKTEGSAMTVTLTGRLDTTTAPQLESELKAELDGVDSLVMDFEKLEYISSAGLRVLLSAQKIMSGKGGMVIRHVSDVIMEIFDVTGFSDILSIEA